VRELASILFSLRIRSFYFSRDSWEMGAIIMGAAPIEQPHRYTAGVVWRCALAAALYCIRR